jgi:hypothetical protein
MSVHTRLIVAALLLFLDAIAFGCSSPAESSRQRVVGIIDNGGTGIDPLLLPDTVYVGVPFGATVTTFGSACDKLDGSDIQTAGLLADVTPYDLLPPAGTVCIALLRASPRSLQLSFAAPGSGPND